MWRYQRCLLSKKPVNIFLNILGRNYHYKSSSSPSASSYAADLSDTFGSLSLQLAPENRNLYRQSLNFDDLDATDPPISEEYEVFLNSFVNHDDPAYLWDDFLKKIESYIQEPNTPLQWIKDFSSKDPYRFLNKIEAFELLERSFKEADFNVLGALKDIIPPVNRCFSRKDQQKLFASLFEHPEIDFLKAVKFANEMVNLRLIKNRDVFLEVAAYHLWENKNMSYQDAFNLWKSACSADNTIAGGNAFMERVLSDKKLSKTEERRRIKELVRFFEKVKSPNDAIAHLIVSLISTGRVIDAKVLWLRFLVQPIHFMAPIRNLENDNNAYVNILHIRDFARLLEECVLVELKPKKKSKKKPVVAEVEEINDPEELSTTAAKAPLEVKETTETKPTEPDYGDMEYLIEYWQPRRKKKYGKKPKLQKFYVSPAQLEHLQKCVKAVEKKLEKAKTTEE